MTALPAAGDPSDIRFQFEIIKQLSENGRVMAQNLAEMQKTQVAMLERLVRIESNAVNETVAELKATTVTQAQKIDRLERLEDLRAGESASKAAFIKWWPAIAMLLLVVWTIGRATGFFNIPEPPHAIAGAVK